ncbi:hypothetical protein SporoP37_01880 [Sporosarcina sp. P37]|uniref:hypothetical protein n=1 Tax=unclassified Sporosarcina TaxID=2647733 RepID=UPI000A17ECFC|nr:MULTISPECIES: hypothetical protein [unclassified Sporosarcina]ARK23564.1 hypothetical protein SporoP37_01880 [Sporosarcina sp. P37]PID18813.1 hypothetical protein CSV62_06870 [Sporosarcina sp. P35]
MPYFKISNTGGSGGGSEPVDYTELIQSIRDKGGTVADGATLSEIIIAVTSIPDYVEPLDLQPIAQAIRDKGGTIAEGNITVLDLLAAIATIPDPGVSPECPLPGVPIGPTIKEVVVFPEFIVSDSVTVENVEV